MMCRIVGRVLSEWTETRWRQEMNKSQQVTTDNIVLVARYAPGDANGVGHQREQTFIFDNEISLGEALEWIYLSIPDCCTKDAIITISEPSQEVLRER